MDSQSTTDPSGHGPNCLPSKLGKPKGSYFILGHIQSYQPLNDWVIQYSDLGSGLKLKWYMLPPKPKTSKRKDCFHSGSGQRGCHVPITLKVIDSHYPDFWSPRHITGVAGPWNVGESSRPLRYMYIDRRSSSQNSSIMLSPKYYIGLISYGVVI